ncbi:MAG: hypothetical protein KatS3mg088_382 [Patescibacteria group bacterium]|nr:MAG: hypothetical protein KatS3mg088_382 [Patescibacteria group bacterium]
MNKNLSFSKIFLDGKRPFLWIFGFGFVLYLRGLFFGFSYFDDNVLILENLFFLRDLSNLPRAFTTEVFHILHSSAAYYRPLLTISYMFDAVVSGENPFVYHLTSILIHLFVSIFVFIFFEKLKIKRSVAFLLSFIFLVHPVLAQAVVWIPGRNDSLLAFFVLPTFIFLINFLENKKLRDLWLSILFFGFSLFTKESSVFIPFLILFFGFSLSENKKLFIKTLPVLFFGWGVIFLLWFYLRSIALSSSPVPYTFFGSIKSILNNMSAVFLYLGKVILPFNLSVLPTLQDSILWYGFISVFLIIFFFVVSKNKNYWIIAFGIAWFLVFLLPSFIRPTSYVSDFLEHRIYLPLVGLFLIFSQFSFVKNFDFEKKSNLYLFFLIVFFFSTITFLHIGKFKDRVTFWSFAVKTTPHHPLAHKNLGAMYYLEGNYDLAKNEFIKAAELNFQEPMIHNNLGLIYMREGKFDKAEDEFNLELKVNPNYDNALFNLGLLYWNQDKKDKAAEMWIKTISVNPDHKDALKGLAVYYSEIKDSTKANYFYQEALKRGVRF